MKKNVIVRSSFSYPVIIQFLAGFSMSQAVIQYLAVKVGRDNAYNMVKTAIKKAKPEQTLRQVILSTLDLKKNIGNNLNQLSPPESYIGTAPTMVDRTVRTVTKGI
ncbi:MAG: hypothetical protein ACPGUD_14225 [Parashewanella sp.]